MNASFDTLIPNYARLPMVPVRGEGCWLWDADGRRYLDFAAGVAVNTLGHCHPVMVEALREQSQKLIHCSNLYSIQEQAELARFLTDEVVEASGKCFFCNSGAEANEALVKLARLYGNAAPDADGVPRFEVLTFSKSFHGRTLATIAATEQEKVRQGFAPYMPGFRYVPFNDPAALAAAIRKETVALLVEPVQGEGGINVATPEFLHALKDACARHDLLLMVDEIQCGLGRVGHACGWKAAAGDAVPDLQPDAISWAKGLGGGFPIGSIWASDRLVTGTDQKVSELLSPGKHGSTFGGSPLVSTLALAVQREVKEKDLAGNATALGDYVKAQVNSWDDTCITGVRGLGLMLGFLLQGDAPEGMTLSGYVQQKLMASGLLVVPAGADVIRWLPPLNVTREEIDQGLEIMRTTLKKD
ncbi:MAG: acetylornithine/N-succinyldiaminopimelate aminotransferase [Verrucomicrobiales bacterium]|jgi:acetylornithine/N-succinyldiaminopimelate aminotransferase